MLKKTRFSVIYIKALANRNLSSPFVDPTFVLHGYSNWKNAMSKNKGFYKYESSDAHSEASSRIAAQSQHADVGSLISSSYATKSSENRNILNSLKGHFIESYF